MNTLEALLILNHIPRCHAHIIEPLIDICGGGPQALFQKQHQAFIASAHPFGKRFVALLKKHQHTLDVYPEQKKAAALDINLISFFDDRYPTVLREIYDPPLMLYVKGSLAGSDILVGIVGSRSASVYGREMAEHFAYTLGQYGVGIVSGMARGIDGAAHTAALKADAHTIAVLGCGVNVIYPREHRALYERITEQGAVISELPLDTKPFPVHFPRRNRIISGLSRGTLVVEAARRSGSLITARCALEQGREVFSMPGKVNALLAQGTNDLIQQGAQLVMRPEDIMEVLFPEWEMVKADRPTREQHTHVSLCDHDYAIFQRLQSKPLLPDALMNMTGLAPVDFFPALTRLETARKARRILGGGYVKC